MEKLVPCEAAMAAASELERDWPNGATIATTEHMFSVHSDDEAYLFYVFLCGSRDGGRWFVAATRYGHVAYASKPDLDEIKAAAQEVVR